MNRYKISIFNLKNHPKVALSSNIITHGQKQNMKGKNRERRQGQNRFRGGNQQQYNNQITKKKTINIESL